jgi:hypothetical protein
VFVLPEEGATTKYPDNAERFYSFDYGPVHFVALDTEHAFIDTARRQAQLAWLDADLAATTQPWKVVYFPPAAVQLGVGTWLEPRRSSGLCATLRAARRELGVERPRSRLRTIEAVARIRDDGQSGHICSNRRRRRCSLSGRHVCMDSGVGVHQPLHTCHSRHGLCDDGGGGSHRRRRRRSSVDRSLRRNTHEPTARRQPDFTGQRHVVHRTRQYDNRRNGDRRQRCDAGGVLFRHDTAQYGYGSSLLIQLDRVSAGTYSVAAIAYDGDGASATTAAATITAAAAVSPPTGVVFQKSADHATLVTSYELRIFANGANPNTATTIARVNLGKPTPATNGEITVSLPTFFSNLPVGTYVAAVAAIGVEWRVGQHRGDLHALACVSR